MSGVKKLVVREGLILNNLPPGLVGSSLLTINPSTNEVGTTSAIDTSTFITKSLQDTYILIGDAANLAQPRQVSGAISITRLGVTSITPLSITDGLISAAAAIQYNKLSLSNSIRNVDISTAAAIAKNKIANGTPNRILINDGSGIFSEAPAITGSKLLVSDPNGIPTDSVATLAEAAFLSGVGSSIQTQLNNKLSFSSAITPIEGDLVYYTGGAWNRLPRGTSGQYLAATPSTIQWVTVPNGLPTGGTANQYLTKIDGTDFNTQWSDLTLAKVTDVLASLTQVNALATGYYDATSSVQGQISSKIDKTLQQNYLIVGDASNLAVGLASGSNGYVLTSVGGVPTWVAPGTGGTVTSVAASGGSTGLSFTGSPITGSGTLTITGTLGTVNGGTNLTSYTTGDILYASAANVLSKLPVSTNGFILTLAAGVPTWAANSGGGISGLTTNRIPYATSSTTLGDDSALTWDATNNAITIGIARIHSTGTDSFFAGNTAGNFTTTATGNTGIGKNSLTAITTGIGNTSVGDHALDANADGSANTCIGQNSLGANISGVNNVALGYSSLLTCTGNHNIAVGTNAADALTTGSQNIVIGYNIDAQSATTNGQLSIQNIIFGASNTATGTTKSTGQIGIGQVSPTYQLHITGNAANKNLFLVEEDGGTNILEIIEAAGVNKIGFFAAAPVAQQSVNTILVNNVTSGGTLSTIANYTDLTTYSNDAAAIRNNFFRLTEKVLKLETALRNYGLIID